MEEEGPNPATGNIIVQRLEITIDQTGRMHYEFRGLDWHDAIKLLELTKLYIFAANSGPKRTDA